MSLATRDDDSDALDDPIDEIVAICIESDPALLDSTVSKACDEHPQHAREIRTRIEALRACGLVRPSGSTGDERYPERLAEFQLLERLGGGGMGVVFRARQDPLGREVALKLIRPEHLYFPRARERFKRETGAVARLQHAGIVPIYTVGEDGGVPFFAMELIAGCTLGEALMRLRSRAPETLTGRDLEQAIRASLAPWARAREPAPGGFFEQPYVACVVALIATVADALEHAHSRGVLHRDVKPSNIAVTLDARALLFDFGLASLSDRPAQLTASHAEIGSLLYMSPEHLGRDGAELDGRSDVYSLGVGLYELLALQVPYFDPDPERTRRAILDGRPDPLRARNRSVSRDLETVCLKAFERERERRYASAADFARDLRNVLEHRPIEARPPSAALRLQRWVQRHPTASVATAAGALLLVGAPSLLLWREAVYARELQRSLDETKVQRDLAHEKAAQASDINAFLLGLFQGADPNAERGSELTARELLEVGVDQLESARLDQPLVRASLYDAIGQSFLSLGDYARAEPLLVRALDLRERAGGMHSGEAADSLATLSHLERRLSRPSALEHARRAAELRRELASGPDVDTVHALNAYGLALVDGNQRRDAIDVFREALSLAARLPSESEHARSVVLGNLADALIGEHEYEQAIAASRESIAIERKLFGEQHAGITTSLGTIARALGALRRYDEAREVYAELLEREQRASGDTSERYAVFLSNFGLLCAQAGDLDRARELCERAQAILADSVPSTSASALGCRQGWAFALVDQRLWAEAARSFEELAETLDRGGLIGTPRGWLAQVWSAWCREATGDVAAAERALELAVARAANENTLDWKAVAQAQLARWLAARGEVERAGELAELALARRNGEQMKSAVDQWATLAAGCTARAAGDRERASAEFEQLAEFESGPAHAEWAPSLARAELAALLAQMEPERALTLAERAARELDQRLGAEHPRSRAARATLDALRALLVK